MSKVDQETLTAFGQAVKRAVSLKGMTLDELSSVMDGACGKSMLSKITKGTRDTISPRIVGKLIAALALEEAWIDRFLNITPSPEAEETKAERDADLMIAKVRASDTLPQTSEELLILLANTHAEGQYTDRMTAYVGLTKALEAAERIRKRGAMPADNTGSQLNAVMAEVARLNSTGALAEAEAVLEAEEHRMRQEHKANRAREDEQSRRLLEQRLDQDRLRDDPVAAAERIIRDLMRQAPPGGVFWATQKAVIDWRDRGERQGNPFDLRVSLTLANRNSKRAKGPNKAAALINLGHSLRAIGDRRSDLRLLQSAEKAFRAALKTTSKGRDPVTWASAHSGLGNVLSSLGDREQNIRKLSAAVEAYRTDLRISEAGDDDEYLADSQHNLGGALQTLGALAENETLLEEAMKYCDAALVFRTKEKSPERWANTKLNQALAMRALGRVQKDPKLFDQAQLCYEEALQIFTPEHAVHDWANLIGGLGELALDRFALDNDAIHLDEAEKRLNSAREVMLKSNDFLADRCDALLEKIATARKAA